MKKSILILWAALAFAFAAPQQSLAQYDEPASTEVVNNENDEEYADGPDIGFESENADATVTESSNSGGSFWENALDVLLAILAFAAIVWMIGHMSYELFVRKNPFKPITREEMAALRSATGRPEEMTDDEINQVLDLLEQERISWTPLHDKDDSRIITTKAMIDSCMQTVDKIKVLAPTETETIGAVNSFIDIMHDSYKREFTGSKLLVGILVVFLAIMIYNFGWGSAPFFILSGVTYIMSAMTPNFMSYRRELKGKNGPGALNWLLGGVFAVIGSAQTIRYTTKWSDGTTTHEDDNSQHYAAWAIGFIVIMLLLFCLLIWAAVNYLRNYVFYR